MHQHGPDPLAGPLRGTSAWWHGRTPDQSPPETVIDSPAPLETVSPPPAARVRKRGPRKIRTELVDRVRKEIAEGTYDTPDRFQAALERLLDRLWD
jgi:hypothetical protein